MNTIFSTNFDLLGISAALSDAVLVIIPDRFSPDVETFVFYSFMLYILNLLSILLVGALPQFFFAGGVRRADLNEMVLKNAG